MGSPRFVISATEGERIQKMGKYFRAFLAEWFAGIVMGIRQTPGVSRELALSLLEYAAAALIASSDAAAKEPDDDTAARCEAVAKQMFELLEREVVS